MLKEEIMDIDDTQSTMTKTLANLNSAKLANLKVKLLCRLEASMLTPRDIVLTKNLSLAITIQTIFSEDPEILERLFCFFINKNQIEMALDLWENSLLKKFNLAATSVFDLHLKKISIQVINHLSVKEASRTDLNLVDKVENMSSGEFYLQLFLKLSPASQEKLVTQILEKFKTGFGFLRTNMPEGGKKDQPAFDITDFYSKLVEVKETIFLTKSLLSIYRKMIPEYGLFLIDGFLNIEKQLFANLIQQSSNLPGQTDQILSNIEKRSLNLIRRICVVELIPEFIYLIDKLDNRHCYRWIEKSLEFFTKYTMNAIEARCEKGVVKLDYLSIRLLNPIASYRKCSIFDIKHSLICRDISVNAFSYKAFYISVEDYLHVGPRTTFTKIPRLISLCFISNRENFGFEVMGYSAKVYDVTKLSISSWLHNWDLELYGANEDEAALNEKTGFMSKNLSNFVDYKYTTNLPNASPFEQVYCLLDEISKKLDWPPLPTQLQTSASISNIEAKLTHLLSLKSKSVETNKSASVSSLNKQISFYGIAFFFQNLIEFNAVNKAFFNSKLVIARRCNSTVANGFLEKLEASYRFNDVIEFAVRNIIYCLKLWQKFNSHKEFSTIVTKCLSNSKLDSLTCYKNFLVEFYDIYAFKANTSSNLTWDSVSALKYPKLKLAAVVNLFITEKSQFNCFFNEMLKILQELSSPTRIVETSFKSSCEIILSNHLYEIFELSLANFVQYFTRLIIEKLYLLFIEDKEKFVKWLSDTDTLLGHLMVIIQVNLRNDSAAYILEIYDIVFHIIKIKGSFNYPNFFEYFYDILILQDFLSLINGSEYEANTQWILTHPRTDLKKDLVTKFHNQVNCGLVDKKYFLMETFFSKHAESLAEHMNKLFQN